MAYVAVIIQSRLTGMAQDLEEAAQDLGAKPLRVLIDITLPLLAPGMLAGWLLAFTLSLDDLIIASFVTGPGNALATIIILVVAIGVLVAAWVMFRQQKQRELELSMSEET
jgi:putrescine transport system permease protein